MTRGPETLQIVASWTPADHDQPAHATYRCLLPLPGDGLAAGTDYGLTLFRDGRWTPFPYPAGARRESRRVESMAAHEGALYVTTQKNHYRWPFEGEAAGRGFQRDAYGVVVELRSFHSSPAGLLTAWSDRLEGARGPGELICFANTPLGVFGGTLDGQLWRLDDQPLRTFASQGRPDPVRYLAWAHDRLWVAAGGRLLTWAGQVWTERPGEPYALHTGPDGTLWTLRQGQLHASRDGDWPAPLDLPLTRPWALAAVGEDLWVGCVGRLVQAR